MKKYLIIGASSGIGKATAELLSNQGHQVIGTRLSSEIADFDNVSFQTLNVLDEEIDLDLPEVLDGLVFCPGAIDLKPFTRIKPDAFMEDFQLQVLGAIKVIQYCLDKLKKSEQASIVLFSTVAVQMGFNFHSKVSVSKGAIEGLVKALSAELAPKIRINGIAPSLTDTPLAKKLLSNDDKKAANAERHPLKKIGEANDIAEITQFLLSDKSSWITGQIMHVDGGMSSIRG